MVPSFWQARFVMVGGDGAAISVRWSSGADALPSCLVVIATTTILYSVKGPAWTIRVWLMACEGFKLTTELTQFLQRVVMNSSFTSHSILRIVLRHSQMSLIEWRVIDSINEIRSVRPFRLVPWDFDGRWCHFVYGHVARMRWNCWKQKKRRINNIGRPDNDILMTLFPLFFSTKNDFMAAPAEHLKLVRKHIKIRVNWIDTQRQ